MLGLIGVDTKAIWPRMLYMYTSDKGIQEMVYIISEMKEMKESKHFALMMDDCTVIEQLAIHGRYIDSNTGDLKTHFLKILDTLRNCVS